MNVAYEIQFDIESFLKSMERKARPAAQRRGGGLGEPRRDAMRGRVREQAEPGSGAEQRVRRAPVGQSLSG
jgi:hypothetical protein